MAVSPRRVRRRAVMALFNTSIVLLVLAVAVCVAMYYATSYIGIRACLNAFATMLMTSFVMFLFSEVLIVMMTNAVRAEEEEYPEFWRAIREICKERRMALPRLYVCKMGGMPNAFAFGWGFFRQYAVGITPEIYELLSYDELKGVLAHEIAHIRCRDTGLMSVMTLLLNLFNRGVTLILNNPLTRAFPLIIVLAWPLQLFARLVLRFAVSTIQQEREYAADALGSYYVGTTVHLKSALQKLQDKMREEQREQERERYERAAKRANAEDLFNNPEAFRKTLEEALKKKSDEEADESPEESTDGDSTDEAVDNATTETSEESSSGEDELERLKEKIEAFQDELENVREEDAQEKKETSFELVQELFLSHPVMRDRFSALDSYEISPPTE